MRKLKQSEIDNAPEWATDFAIIKGQVIMIGGGQITKPEGQKVLWAEVFEADFKPIPRPEFDISEHEFSNKNISRVFCDSEVISTIFSITTLGTKETRDDIILKAKHFKLTAEDLK